MIQPGGNEERAEQISCRVSDAIHLKLRRQSGTKRRVRAEYGPYSVAQCEPHRAAGNGVLTTSTPIKLNCNATSKTKALAASS